MPTSSSPAASLYAAKRTRHPRVRLFPRSVDDAHFRPARDPQPEPDAMVGVPRPRIGFAGVIDERMDVTLLGDVADRRPDWQLIMVGPVVKIDPGSLPRRPNIHWLGMRDYRELPAYFASWDVGMMPFARNESTRFISPTKTLEYLAAGLPVVSTPIADVVEPYGTLGLVRLGGRVRRRDRARAGRTARAPSRARRRDPRAHVVGRDVRRHGERDRRRARPGGRTGRRGGGRMSAYDYLIVGAGFAGAVLAERLASVDQRVLVVDRRPHVGGNAYDEYDAAGVLVHRYGPHIFHTNSAAVFDFLSRFTDWRPYEHRVLADVGDGVLVPMPINRRTVSLLAGRDMSCDEVAAYLASVAEPRDHCRSAEDVVVGQVGRRLYELLYRTYTRKQWGLDPSQLDARVTKRLPIRTDDDRYFTDTYQAMPVDGYTPMFERMLAHPNIDISLDTDFRELPPSVEWDQLVYTGPIDEYFEHRHGRLPYRSLRFELVTHDVPRALPAAVVNHPRAHVPYTRVTEFKWLTGQTHACTSLAYEYPTDDGDPYYPVLHDESRATLQRYREAAAQLPNVHFTGRLGTFQYYNMDQVVAQSLALFARLTGGKWASGVAQSVAG